MSYQNLQSKYFKRILRINIYFGEKFLSDIYQYSIKNIESKHMKSKAIFNDLYDRLSHMDEIQQKAPTDPVLFKGSLQRVGSTHRHNQLKALKCINYSLNKEKQKGMVSNGLFFPGSLFNNEYLKEKYTGNFVQVSPSRLSDKKVGQIRQNQSQTPPPKRISLYKDGQTLPDYITISQNKRKPPSWFIKKKQIEDLPSMLNKRNQKILEKNQLTIKKNKNPYIIKPEPSSPPLSSETHFFSQSVSIRKQFQQKDQSKSKTEKKVLPAFETWKKPKAEENRKTQQQQLQQQRKAKLEMKKQISQEYAKPFNPPNNITAYAYVVYEPDFSRKFKNKMEEDVNEEEALDMKVNSSKKFPHSHKIITSQNSRNAVEVASLTKIMTCILAVNLCEEHGIDAEAETIEIGRFQSEIGGTSAQIASGQRYTLEDLFYGLMLPSGNDASIAIAVWGGKVLLKSSTTITKKKICYQRFITEMNNKAKKLGMQKTNYANSHGLVNSANKSCAYDIAILCEYAMSNKKFRNIVSTKQYRTKISFCYRNTSVSLTEKKSMTSLRLSVGDRERINQIEEDEEKYLDSNEDNEELEREFSYQIGEKSVYWQNTHKLLHQKPEEYIGIKTGITTAAGPCLASCVRSRSNRQFIVVVLGCEKLSLRFKDTQNLKKWTYNREGLKSPRKKKVSTKSNNNSFKTLSPIIKPIQIQ